MVVVCVVDGETIEAVVPSSFVVDLNRLVDLAGGCAARLAEADELREPLAASRVFVDVLLAGEPAITVRRGANAEEVVLRWPDFARTVRPIVGRFAERTRDRVPLYRLSSRE
jgi:prolyl-tRNA editing enzyme YbaK/EbsC (Cys-tRNA(Pro) deacylase)